MSRFPVLVISVAAWNVGSSVALKTSARLTTLDLALLVHHKTGTILCDRIAHDVASVLNISEHRSPNSILHGQCYSNTIGVYGGRGTLRTIRSCPRMRAVHIMRRPTSAFVSDYVYEKNLLPSEADYKQWCNRNRSDVFKKQSLSAGVQSNCQWWFSDWPGVGQEIADMVETHRHIQLRRRRNVLEVEFEDFGSNYDKTWRSIFEHFLGNNDPRIDALVELAGHHDLGRQSQSHRDANPHVSKKSQKADTLMEIKRQYLAGDPCIKKLVESDQLLGYGSQLETW